jgi:integrase
MQTASLLTPVELADILGISEYTVLAMAHSGIIPHTYIQAAGAQDRLLRFDPYIITEWLQTNPKLDGFTEKDYADGLKKWYQARFPQALSGLKALDAQFSPPREGKGYSLTKVPSKQYGFLYYARYIENGKLISSRWNTHTKNPEAAEKFARENREAILAAYHHKHDKKDEMYAVLKAYYKKGSPYIDIIKKRGRRLCEQVRGQYHSFTQKTFTPFLKKNRVRCFSEITSPVIAKLQNELLSGGMKPQTINRYMIGMRTIFDHMVREGFMEVNPLNQVGSLKPRPGDSKAVGCYEIGKPDGAFNTSWRNAELHYLLNLLIYTTGMRNSEILGMRPRDITAISSCRFIDIKESKTENGVRLAPLHNFVYAKLAGWIAKNGIEDGKPVFGAATPYDFIRAYKTLGKRLGFDRAWLKEQNITFYSGRHYWKTLMNACGLGDIEEYFMGHKVTKDVSERYNHKDKQGRKRLLAKAREVYKILDKTLLKNRP